MENATVHVVYTHFYAIKFTEANHFQKIIVPVNIKFRAVFITVAAR